MKGNHMKSIDDMIAPSANAKEKIEILHDYIQKNPQQDVSSIIDKNHLLVYAGKYGMLDEVLEFIIAGADVNNRNEAGETLLMQLANGNYFKLAFILLHYPDLDVTARCEKGLTAIEYASDERIIKIIENYIAEHRCGKTQQSSQDKERAAFFDDLTEPDTSVVH